MAFIPTTTTRPTQAHNTTPRHLGSATRSQPLIPPPRARTTTPPPPPPPPPHPPPRGPRPPPPPPPTPPPPPPTAHPPPPPRARRITHVGYRGRHPSTARIFALRTRLLSPQKLRAIAVIFGAASSHCSSGGGATPRSPAANTMGSGLGAGSSSTTLNTATGTGAPARGVSGSCAPRPGAAMEARTAVTIW